MLVIDPTHPALQGNRVFMYPFSVDSGAGWVQLNPLWAFPVNNGLDSASAPGWNQGAHPSILTGASSPGGGSAAFYSYWEDVWPESGSRDITVVARVRLDGSDPGAGGGAFICGARDPGNGGWLFGAWDVDGGADAGLSLFLYDQAGNSWVSTDQDSISSLTGVSCVVAVVYHAAEQEVRYYRNGMMTRRVTNTAHVWDPAINSTGNQFTIGRANSGFAWPGDIGWVMVFARAVSEAELMELTRDEQWPFVWEDPGFLLEDAHGTYTTTASVASSYSPSTAGAVTYVTEIDAEAFVEGDFTVTPDPPATGTYTTIIGVGSSAYYDSPEFGVFITVVAANSQITATAPVTFTTSVGVTSLARGLLDGRRNLIDTARYRR